ncbi:hypothetical protein DYBT9275_02461 [Dyadobacter sp. CECT 9275]|uniref:Xylose isomerase-like TIM barrel domain-containing protein n=1 Tax=Dyadobacter helix TaxID=2822344 RepID=A0A916N4G5_9BACT|nr:sugar phosphate isomerase/epimerase family protein [Dyadobacter sp. CECT 9275]CAG5000426.1 hypothetical protein DYBT9275_02461 [Dyadobacter sp. CECT 9275]
MKLTTDATRRDFLKVTSGLAGLAMLELSFDFARPKPLLSFSTLGCPAWSFEKILQYAADNHYQGIEIRGILDQMDLPKCPEFNSPEHIRATKKMIEDRGIKIVSLDSSAKMHFADPAKRQANLDEARRFIDLAKELQASYIRVFPEDLPKDQERQQTIDLISKGLLELADYAKGSGVTVLLESHGQVVSKDILSEIMKAAEHRQVGMIWDIVNMWSVTKEAPAEVYAQLKKYIRHIHVKDAVWVEGKEKFVKIGEGIAPLTEAFKALQAGGYKGYYSFEWEKRWHPEIEDPEITIPHYPVAMKKYF